MLVLDEPDTFECNVHPDIIAYCVGLYCDTVHHRIQPAIILSRSRRATSAAVAIYADSSSGQIPASCFRRFVLHDWCVALGPINSRSHAQGPPIIANVQCIRSLEGSGVNPLTVATLGSAIEGSRLPQFLARWPWPIGRIGEQLHARGFAFDIDIPSTHGHPWRIDNIRKGVRADPDSSSASGI